MDLMRSQGHETALFSVARGGPGGHPHENYFVPGINLKDGGLRNKARAGLRAIYSWKARQCLREMLREFKPDVAHVRNIYHHMSPSILWELKAHGIPVIYHLNDLKLLCPSYNMVAQGKTCERCQGGRFWHVMTEGCYRGSVATKAVLAAEAYTHKWLGTYRSCVDLFLAPSEFVKRKLVEHGWDEAKIAVLPHFQWIPAEAEAPQKNAPILYFGRLSPEKGIPDLLEAMRKVPQVKLQIAGDGSQRAELERIADTLQLNVEFLGQLQGEALSRVIAASLFTVFPSRAYETFGKSILESYACARAVIASDLGSRRELVHEGKTGLLYPTGNAAKLAEAIAQLVAHPELATSMGQAGLALARANYSPEQHYDGIFSFYQKFSRKHPENKDCTPAIQPIKVAFIGGRGVGSKYSGIETYYEEMGQHLAAKGHKVTAYCRSYFTPDVQHYKQMHIVRFPTIRSKHLETFVHTLLSTVHATFGPYDIVHFHALGPALFSFLPRLAGKKTAVTVQGLDWQRKKWGRVAAWVLRLGEKASVRFPDQTMVVSRTLQDFYRTRHGSEPHYVPNGTQFRSSSSDSWLGKWGLTKKQYVLYLGRFSPEKNCHLLMEAFRRIKTPVKLVMAGGSSHSDEYVEGLRQHQDENVLLLDWIGGNALDELLANAMLFVLPSDLEGMSLALLDAMGAGVCVLASDIPENRELVEDAGFTFAQGDVPDLERMLRFLITNPVERQKYASLGKKRVEKYYLWPGIADTVEQIYRGMLDPDALHAIPIDFSSQKHPRKLAA